VPPAFAVFGSTYALVRGVVRNVVANLEFVVRNVVANLEEEEFIVVVWSTAKKSS